MPTTKTSTANRLTAPARAALRKDQGVLLFEVAGQAYGLPLHDVREVMPMALLACPPTLPTLLAGLLNLGGIAIPVLRLDRLFRLPEQPAGRYTPLLILRLQDSHLALVVDRISRIAHLDVQAVAAVQEHHTLNGCAVGIVPLDGQMVLLLAAERLLSEKEQQCLAEIQDREQARLRDLEGNGR